MASRPVAKWTSKAKMLARRQGEAQQAGEAQRAGAVQRLEQQREKAREAALPSAKEAPRFWEARRALAM